MHPASLPGGYAWPIASGGGALSRRRHELVADLLEHEEDRVERAVHVAELLLHRGPVVAWVEAVRQVRDRALDPLERVHQVAYGIRDEAWHPAELWPKRQTSA